MPSPTLLRLLLPLALVAGATAADRYVDPAGDDGRDGASPASAWRTVAQVNAAALAPGDRVLFRRGGVWRESLRVPASGAAGAPITFADYGSGAKPRFDGGDLLTKAAFHDDGGGVWSCPAATQVWSVLVDDAFLVAGDPAATPGTWSWGGGTLRIRVAGDPRSDAHAYVACIREDAIHTNWKSHLVLRNLVTDHTARFGGGYGIRVEGATDALVDGCEVYRAGKHHFGCINSTQVVHKDCVAAYAMPGQGSGGATAYVSYGDAGGMPNQVSEYRDCLAEHLEDGAGGSFDAFYTHGDAIGSVLLHNLTARGSGWAMGRDGGAAAATLRVEGGLIEDGRLVLYGDRITVDGLRITGANGSIDASGADTVLENLVIDGTAMGGWYKTAILFRAPRGVLRLSTIVLGAGAGGDHSCVALAGTASDFTCQGNILWANGRALGLWEGRTAGSVAAMDGDVLRSGATFDSETFAQWQGHGFEAHGQAVAAAGFVDAAAHDLHLRADSPAVDAAPLPHALTASVPTDADGHARLQGAEFDAGAFERGAAGGGTGSTGGGTGSTGGGTGSTGGGTGSAGDGSGSGHAAGCGSGSGVLAVVAVACAWRAVARGRIAG